MNERIRELWNQSRYSSGRGHDEEKFAELIVRECAKFAYHYVDGNETLSHYREKDWKELPGDIEFCMKVHFGVEE